MKTNVEIIKILEDKRTEHEIITKQIAKDLEIVRAKLAEMIQGGADKGVLIPQSNVLMVLKDRLLFHKTCVLLIDDVLKESK